MTTVSRVLREYVANTKPTEELVILTTFIVRVYTPMWFHIKLNEKLADAAKNLWLQTVRIRYHNETHKSIVHSVVQQNWKLPSGNLGTMESLENIRYSSDWTTEECTSKPIKDVPEPSEKEQMDFLHNFKDIGKDVSLFNILEDFSNMKTSETLGKILYNDNLAKEPLENLIKVGKTITLKTHKINGMAS